MRRWIRETDLLRRVAGGYLSYRLIDHPGSIRNGIPEIVAIAFLLVQMLLFVISLSELGCPAGASQVHWRNHALSSFEML